MIINSKKITMIIAIVVSIFSAQGGLAQDTVLEKNTSDSRTYQNEQQEYTEMATRELPYAIQNATAQNFGNLNIYRAYMSKDSTYKLVLKNRHNLTKIVFASASGQFIKPNDRS